MRLDKYLWFVRATKTRSEAQRIAETGTLRIDGRPIDRAHADVRVGQVLTFVQGNGARGDAIRVLRVEALPTRRGPAPEAQACYRDLAARLVDVDAGQT